MARPTEEREISLQKTERVYVRLSLGILLGLILLVALSWGGRRLYVRWQEHKLMRQAHLAFDKADYRWAALAAQRAFSLDPSSLEACRTLADLAEKQHNVEAIEWRRRAVALAPKSVPDHLALARTALTFGQPKIAATALAPLAAAQAQNADYQAAAARIALAQGDEAAARQHLQAAARLAPNEPERQLELAEFQMRTGDGAERATGRDLAERLQRDPKVRVDALHVLIDDALRHRDGAAAIAVAKKLDALPDAAMDDRLLALGILRGFKDAEFPAALTRLEADSAKSAERAVKLMGWLNNHGLALLGIDWSKRLPAAMRTSVGWRFALADAYVQLRDWKELQELLQGGSWDQAESLRLALQAKAARETGDERGFEKSWGSAVAKAGGDGARLNVLQNLAFRWSWPEKAVAVLWTLAGSRETEQEALQALYRYYAEARDSTGLYRALARLVTVMPGDLTVKNNFAQISLLLQTGQKRALELAQQVHQAQPQNAAFASTYAFALYRNGDVPGALKVMGALAPEQLNDPSVAAYYGVILAAAGKKAEAARYLDAARPAKLLPEEEAILAQARTILSPPAPYHGP